MSAVVFKVALDPEELERIVKALKSVAIDRRGKALIARLSAMTQRKCASRSCSAMLSITQRKFCSRECGVRERVANWRKRQ